MADSNARTTESAFRPRARLLQILGDQLIGSPRLAVFELVKNAYDADASEVVVSLLDLDEGDPRIEVKDDGSGMSFETIRDIWLVPADDHRERQREEGRRSPRFNRLPLGEKGVGRFAVHKLGDWIELITRAAGERECLVRIDWREMMQSRLLEEAKVTVAEREAEVFTGDETGTRVRIKDLRETEWTRRDVRELWRQLTSITSPFRDQEDTFNIDLEVPDHSEWLSDLPDVQTLMEQAPWVFTFEFDGDTIDWDYTFRGVPNLTAKPRRVSRSEALQILDDSNIDDVDEVEGRSKRRASKVVADLHTLIGIGPVSGTFHIWDRDKLTMLQYPNRSVIDGFLNQNGGVRVYRDDVRVYNYGEKGDDWLSLDIRRVNSPTKNISRNILIGQIDLDLSASTGLREKTNREGFVLNAAYGRLRQVVLGALATAEGERQKDKAALREAVGEPPRGPQGITKPLAQLRKEARKHGVAEQMEPSIRKIEQDYEELRDSFLRSGMSNVGLAIVFTKSSVGSPCCTRPYLREARSTKFECSRVSCSRSLSNRPGCCGRTSVRSTRSEILSSPPATCFYPRFRFHRIRLVSPILQEGTEDGKAIFAFNLALGALTNLLDNAIHWLKVAHPEEDGDERRLIYLDVVDWKGSPAIVVADNGTGFKDSPAEVVQPFFSRRPDGMGLGLYYANIVMQLNDGRLELAPAADIDAPNEFDGAAAALVFRSVR